MKNVTFSSELFGQIGGSNWSARPGYFDTQSLTLDTLVEEPKEAQTVDKVVENQNVEVPLEPVVDKKTVVKVDNAVVIVGSGLDAIWDNEEALAWRLWLNIMQAFSWDDSQVVFYDTDHLVSEDMIFSTMEEIIDLGVEWVLMMDESHSIAEQLAEGLNVVEVPDLEYMLSDPYAKQSFYQSVVTLS